ncbi:alanine racemase [Bradyrhizobium sp. Ash2021]|uniref:alanine racemase n=1 Tax=Bradyrhizobium sp. Ash2021 TaxID=2954771 RepID=UPI00281498A2|nr:alanine racemase [Bradyrhizobium sp. Ash2021]WMT79606.1 alanine racemase [Bradyrhizobium sp. Ash2021]
MDSRLDQNQISPPQYRLPDDYVSTPCFVIFEEGIRHNLKRTIEACGGVERLMPHVKTHRAPWIVQLLLDLGVEAFKCATPAEVEMAVAAGAKNVTWAYPSVNPANVARFLSCARNNEGARLTGMVDSKRGLDSWNAQLGDNYTNVDLRVDLDPGMGRTGAPMTAAALDLAFALHDIGRFAGWHAYDGHIKGDRDARRRQVMSNAEKIANLQAVLRQKGVDADLVAGGSYTFDLWPRDLVRYVSPGSWTYSSAQHDIELSDLEWEQAAFVLTTVISVHAGTATFDAGSKAISPDKPLSERFRWDGRIVSMSEEHTIVEAEGLKVGDRLFLTPQHTCTTAYLYDKAIVKTSAGRWEDRQQLGCKR